MNYQDVPRDVLAQAVKLHIDDRKTRPLARNELEKIFGTGFRLLKPLIDTWQGVEQVGKSYRIPMRHMPISYGE